jgi:hypothetical protein
MRHNLKLIFAVSICLLILIGVAAGQSGRKQKKSDPPPIQGVNQPDARVDPVPEIPPEIPKEKDRRAIMVMTSMPDTFMPLFYADIARRACVSEIREVTRTIDLREAGNQNRSDAIKAAKNDDRTYVILMDLEPDRFGNGRVDLRYTIFEPKTARVAGMGTGYPVQPRNRIPLPPIGATNDQIYLDWAGRDVAQQVMKKLGIMP